MKSSSRRSCAAGGAASASSMLWLIQAAMRSAVSAGVSWLVS